MHAVETQEQRNQLVIGPVVSWHLVQFVYDVAGTHAHHSSNHVLVGNKLVR